MMDNKKIIAILGLGRSGTSTITKALDVIDIDLGNTFLAPSDIWNPKGFWEDSEIYELNEEILQTIGENLNSLSLSPFNFSITNKRFTKHHQKAKQLMQKKYKNNKYFAFKDPRTARLLPFWQFQFKELNIEDSYIITLRNPLASAYSLEKLLSIPIEKSVLLWLIYLHSAITFTKNKKRVIVRYENIINNPEYEINRINHQLEINHPINIEKLNNYSHEFLDKKLNRYETSDEEFYNHPLVPSICKSAYQLLLDAANDKISTYSIEFENRWSEVNKIFENIQPSIEYIEKLFQTNNNYALQYDHILNIYNQTKIQLDETQTQLLETQTQFHELKQRANHLETYIRHITLNGKLKTPLKFLHNFLLYFYKKTSHLHFKRF